MSKRLTGFRIIIIISFFFITGLFVYRYSLNNPLYWDDEVTIIDNVFIRDLKYLKEIFTSGYHQGAGELTNFYRPLATLTFLFEYSLWKLNSFGYHLDNVILHVVNSILLFFLLKDTLKEAGISFLVSLLYLVHPQATEVVNYASHRPELLMMLFFLLGLIFYVRFSERKRTTFLVLSLVSYSLSILSKEMGMILVFYILLYNIFSAKIECRKYILSFILVLAVYLFLKATYLNFLNLPLLKGPQPEAYSESLVERLLIFSKIFYIYLGVLLFPLHLHMDRDIPYLSRPFELRAVLLAVSIIISIIYIIRLRRKSPLVFFGASWFFLGLMPVSGVIPINTAIAEHYLYLTSAGFFIAIAAIASRLYARLKPLFIWGPIWRSAVIIIFILLAILTVGRNKQWNEPVSLYLSTVNNTKFSFRANNNLGVEYFRRGDLEKAEYYFKRSIDINSVYAPALNNLGVIFERHNNKDKAIEYYIKAKESDPRYILAYRNLAQIYLKLGKSKEAEEQLQVILDMFPFDNEAKSVLEGIKR